MWEDGGVGLDMFVLGSGDLAAGGLAIVGVDGCQKKEGIASFSLPFWQFGAEQRRHFGMAKALTSFLQARPWETLKALQSHSSSQGKELTYHKVPLPLHTTGVCLSVMATVLNFHSLHQLAVFVWGSTGTDCPATGAGVCVPGNLDGLQCPVTLARSQDEDAVWIHVSPSCACVLQGSPTSVRNAFLRQLGDRVCHQFDPGRRGLRYFLILLRLLAEAETPPPKKKKNKHGGTCLRISWLAPNLSPDLSTRPLHP